MKTMAELRRRMGVEETDKGIKKSKQPAKIASRGDLSLTRPVEEREKQLADKTIFFGSKGYFGTPLPLIPDIRKCEVNEGVVGLLLDALGVSKRFERIVTLHQGPNKKSNRYLTFQYERLIKSIEGTTAKGDENTPSHVVWTYNFYKITEKNNKHLGSTIEQTNRPLEKKKVYKKRK